MKTKPAAFSQNGGSHSAPVASSPAARSASGHETEAAEEVLWPPNWSGNTNSLPIAEFLIALSKGSGDKGNKGGTSVLYTAKVGSLLGRHEVD